MSSYPSRRHQRLPGFDYTTAGYYFITLCIQDRLPLLGRVIAGEMQCSPAGALLLQVAREMPERYPGVGLDTVMVMPDHLHAIVSLPGEACSLSVVVHWVKSGSTAQYAREVRESDWPPFHRRLWQQGFHDRIIRDERELTAIREYVVQNPVRWSLKRQ